MRQKKEREHRLVAKFIPYITRRKILFATVKSKLTLKISGSYERGADNHSYNAKPPTFNG